MVGVDILLKFHFHHYSNYLSFIKLSYLNNNSIMTIKNKTNYGIE